MRSARATLLAVAALFAACAGCASPARPPSVLLVVLDTVRSDHLSCYGHERPTSPSLDRLAAAGIRFADVHANAGWTLPSHATMFTGVHSVAHGATQEHLWLGTELPTLAEILSARGYATFGSSTNSVVGVADGLARGFDTFVEAFRADARARLRGGRFDSPNNVGFERFLGRVPADRPFFAFLNYIDAHAPYDPPAPYRSRFAAPGGWELAAARAVGLRMADHYLRGPIDEATFDVLGRLYDGEIAYVDDKLGELLEILAASPHAENTIVIVTSDHGENLGEHGHFAHVFSLNETVLRVPLVVTFPDGRGKGTVRGDRAQLVDLLPTILALCGVSHGGRTDGRDLFAARSQTAERPVLAEYYYPRQALGAFDPGELQGQLERIVPFMRRLRSIDDGTAKLIWGSDGRNRLYRIDRDPGESVDLLETEPQDPDAARMESKLTALVDSLRGAIDVGPPPPVGWMVPGFEDAFADDPELIESLRSLGYVH